VEVQTPLPQAERDALDLHLAAGDLRQPGFRPAKDPPVHAGDVPSEDDRQNQREEEGGNEEQQAAERGESPEPPHKAS
jgi:hypothetical protein